MHIVTLKNIHCSNGFIFLEIYEKELFQKFSFVVLKHHKSGKILKIRLKPNQEGTIAIDLHALLHDSLSIGRWQVFFSAGRFFSKKTVLQIPPEDFASSAPITNIIPVTDEIGSVVYLTHLNTVEIWVDKYHVLQEKLYFTETIDLLVHRVEVSDHELRVFLPNANSDFDFHDVVSIILQNKKNKQQIICTKYYVTRSDNFTCITITVEESFIYHPKVWNIIIETERSGSMMRVRQVVKIAQSSAPVLVESYQILDGRIFIKLQEEISWKSEMALLLEHKKDYRLTMTIPVLPADTDHKSIVADLNDFLIQHVEKSNEKWDLYIVHYGEFPVKKRRLVFNYHGKLVNKQTRFTKPIVLSSILESVAAIYLDKNYSLTLYIGNDVKYYSQKYNSFANAKKILKKGTVFELTVFVNLSNITDYQCEAIILKHRTKGQGISYEFPLSLKKQHGSRRWVTGAIDLNGITLEPFYWDLFIRIRKDEEQFLVRVMNLNPILHHKINSNFTKYTIEKSGYIFYPYSTVSNQLSFTYREKGVYDTPKYYRREKVALLLYFILRFYLNRKNIWLIYEKFSETAQDNSFYFFKYCVDQKKSKNVYYVIKKESPDYKKLTGYEKYVLDFMSIRHLLYLLSSKLLISSESKAHAYIWRANRGIIKQKLSKKKGYIFLQHGVTALKRNDVVWRKDSPNGADLFVVTSEFEKEIIKKNFHYNDEDVIVTGFSRWDHLEDRSVSRKEILLMPTWRYWLDEVTDEKFIHSEYFINYSNLLNSKRFQQMLISNNITLNFYVHPKFMQYIDCFASDCPNINIIRFGELQVNELLMRSSLLITDYSSVSWEMYYQRKPTIFFQFDIDQYNFYHGSYLDMDKDLFGDRVFTIDELLNVLNEYIMNDFKEKPVFQARRADFFKYIDKNNSKRIYDEIIRRKNILYRKDTLLDILKRNELLRIIWKNLKVNKRFHRVIEMLK